MNRLAVSAVLLALAAGCGNGDNNAGPRPADAGVAADGTVRCSPACHEHATCEVEGGQAACVCESGYLGDGHACTRKGRWVKHRVGAQPRATYIAVTDVDGDGKPDIVSSSTDHMAEHRSEIAVFRNTGTTSWPKVVVSSPDAAAPVINATGVAVADIDRDGALDVVSAASGRPAGGAKTGGAVYWFKAPTTPDDGSRGAGKSPAGAGWTRFTVIEDAKTRYWKVYALDPDDDADVDIVVGGNSSAVLYENPGDPADPSARWTAAALPPGTGVCIDIADVDGDGKLDVLSANRDAEKVAWVGIEKEADGFSFAETVVAPSLPSVFDITALDANQDGRLDLVVSRLFTAGVHWFEAPSSAGAAWVQHDVDAAFVGTDVYAGDIDGDGRTDLAVAGFSMGASDQPSSLAWFKASTQDGVVSWSKHYIDHGSPAAPGDVSLNDVNGDGRLDLVTTAYSAGEVLWYENVPLQ